MALTLSARGLSGKQKQINEAVNATLSWNSPGDEMLKTLSDAEMLYTIDVASKFKDLNFLINVLKCGNSLFITRAIKHTWIYDTQYSHTINPIFLSNEVFPLMSLVMLKKFLTAICANIRDTERVQSFTDYCEEYGLINLSYKFVIRGPEAYKIDYLDKHEIKDVKILIKIIGKSLKLAKMCTQKYNTIRPMMVTHLYFVSPIQFLDYFEMYEPFDEYIGYGRSFSIDITKHILKNNKDRVLRRPLFYLGHLNKFKAVKYFTPKDGFCIKNDLPECSDLLWRLLTFKNVSEFCMLIPELERFEFLKKIFKIKYPCEPFETTREFVFNEVYRILSKSDQHEWALAQLAKGNGFFGDVEDYSWYKYTKFSYTLDFMKEVINNTSEPTTKMSHLHLLVDATSDFNELELVLKYFNEQHMTEVDSESFVNNVLYKYKMYTIKGECWRLLNNIMEYIGVYTTVAEHQELKIDIIFHHVLNNMEMPQYLIDFFVNDVNMSNVKNALREMKVHKEKLKKGLIEIYINEIEKLENDRNVEKYEIKMIALKEKGTKFLQENEIKYDDYPTIFKTYVGNSKEKYAHLLPQQNKGIKGAIHSLKNDVTLVSGIITLIVIDMSVPTERGRCNILLSKLRIYFPEETIWSAYFGSLMVGFHNSYKTFKSAVYGIFVIGSYQDKLNMIKKYAPLDGKMDRDCDAKLLIIQKFICEFLCYSRPPLPLAELTPFIKGDFLRICAPSLFSFGAILPKNDCIILIKYLIYEYSDPVNRLINYGLEIAFKCLDIQTLSKLIEELSKENAFLKKILFLGLYNRVYKEKDKIRQHKFIDILINIVKTLTEQDDPTLFQCFDCAKIPPEKKGDFLENAYNVLDKADNENISLILNYIANNINFMSKDFVSHIVTQELQKTITANTTLGVRDHALYKVAAAFIFLRNSEPPLMLETQTRRDLLQYIISQIDEFWNLTSNTGYVAREISKGFTNLFATYSVHGSMCKLKSISLNFLKDIMKSLEAKPIEQVYSQLWDISFAMKILATVDDINDWNYDGIKVFFIGVGYAVGAVIDDFVQAGRFHLSLIKDIEEYVNDIFNKVYIYFNSINEDDHKVYFCYGLLKYDGGKYECIIVTINILPERYYANTLEYVEIANKLTSLQQEDIKILIHNRFGESLMGMIEDE